MTDRELISLAKKASYNAYVPYSHFSVGAALQCADGSVIVPEVLRKYLGGLEIIEKK